MNNNPVSPSLTPILVVDDDPDIREALSDRLEYEGYRVSAVGLGEEAIARVREERFGAVVLDMGLPDLHGLAVMKVLMELDPNLPVIVLTGDPTVENTVGSFKKGAFAYLSKPYNLDVIKATLSRALAIKALAVKAERVENALCESEERFRSVVESATDAIVLADGSGNIISWNRAAQRLFAYTEEEVIGEPLTVLMPARYREAHKRGLERVRSSGESRLIGKAVELQGLRKDGSEFPLELSLSMWKAKEGTYYSGIIRDITERKQIQDQLIQAEKMASLGTLVSGMAHEINNPVHGILGMAEIILGEQDSEKIKEYAQDIVNFSKHIATVVCDFSCYARPASRDGEVEIDLGERLAEAVKMVRRGPHFGDVEVETAWQALPPLRARRSEIDQVLVNLISNAVQAMHGRGRLTLATRHCGDVMTAEISDTGCGIPRALLNKIFDPFFTTKEPGVGTGLGLSIAYQIVAKYGGKISVDSVEGQGTTFTIQFPVGNREGEARIGDSDASGRSQAAGASAGGG